MKYEIKLTPSKEKGMVVELVKVRDFMLPTGIALSVMSRQSKIDKLVKYYTTIFTNKDKKYDSFRYTVCMVHKHACQLKSMTILATSKLKDVHTNAFATFIKQSQEDIDLLMPYMLNEGLSSTGVETEAVKTGDPELDAIAFKGQGVEKLSVSDVTQIKTLMKDIAEKEGLQLSPVEKVDDLTIEDEKVDVDTSFSKQDELK